MPAALLPKHEVLDRLVGVFRTHGYEGATLARLSKATGLGRASLYHYFPNGKDDMARAVLAHAGHDFERLVLAPLQDSAAQPSRDRLVAMADGLAEFYAAGTQPCLLELLSSGDAGPVFAEPVGDALARWIGRIADTLAAAGVERSLALRRAEDAVGGIQGALILARASGSTAPFRRLLDGLPDRLLNPKHHSEG